MTTQRRRLVLLVAVIWLPMLAWWLALLPGGMSIDSLDQWGQIRSGHWTSHHPVPDTAFVWLTSLGGVEGRRLLRLRGLELELG